ELGELDVPGFSITTFPKEKLPSVAVPFAPALEGSDVAGDDLRRVADLKNLKSLHPGSTQGTGAGEKHPAARRDLTRLHLGDTEVTEKGLKELAPLTKLTTLHVNPTDANLRALREAGLLHALYLTNEVRGKRPKSADEVTSLSLEGRPRKGMITDAGLK